jgi:hypothetical protein
MVFGIKPLVFVCSLTPVRSSFLSAFASIWLVGPVCLYFSFCQSDSMTVSLELDGFIC